MSIPPGDAGGDRATVIDFRKGPLLSRMGRIRPLVPIPRPAAARAAAMRADIVDRKSTWSSSGESGGGAGTGLWAIGAAIFSSSDSSSLTSNCSIKTAGDAQPTAPSASGPGDRRCSASESSEAVSYTHLTLPTIYSV